MARAVLWGPASAGPPQPFRQPYPVFLHHQALRQLIQHTRSDPWKTLLGFLLGDLYECPNSGIRYALIDVGIRVGVEAQGDRTSALPARVWPRLQEQIPGQGRRLIGWYHHHPSGLSTFSREDIGTHLMYFTQPWQVGLVLGAEDAKPAANWFRASPDENWPHTPLPFYELLEPDSIDAEGKKRSHIDWANFKPYRAVSPPPRKTVTRAARATPAPPAQRASASAEPPAGASTDETPGRAPVEEEAEVLEAPHRGSNRPRPFSPPPVEMDESLPPVRRPVYGWAKASLPDADYETGGLARRSAAQWQPWAIGGLGAVATGLVVAAGWALGLVHFGRLAQPTGNPDATAGAAALASAPENPALALLDQLTDSLLTAVQTYRERRAGFERKQVDCDALAEALVAVESHWIGYNARGKPRDLVLDEERAARDASLYTRVDSVETHFDESACPRP